MKNVTIVNNTIAGHPVCVRANWSNASNMTFANNALYCNNNEALVANGLSSNTVTVKSNYIEGSMKGAEIDNDAFFYGGISARTFIRAGIMDFWPRHIARMTGKADPDFIPHDDFNNTRRTPPYDVGAYETEGLTYNPGWLIAPEFKGTPSGGTRDNPARKGQPSGLQGKPEE